jgi:hypothetical protein
MKITPAAGCIAAAGVCALGVPAAALSRPGLALVVLFGLGVFVLDMRG